MSSTGEGDLGGRERGCRLGFSVPDLASVLALFCLPSFFRGGRALGDSECTPFSPGPPLKVNVSSLGRPTSLFLSWAVPGPGKLSHALRLTHLSPLGSPEGPPLQAHTNASSFEFRDLVPGSRYLLEVTALRPCGQNATVTLTARTGVWSSGWGGARSVQELPGVRAGGCRPGGLARDRVAKENNFSEDHAWYSDRETWYK